MATINLDRTSGLTVDEILRILENPTRRRILERLVKESHYPLQLSRELRVSQQAVVKHLRVLEEGRLVESHEEASDVGGPPRRVYTAKRALSVTIDVGPSLFRTEVRALLPPSSGQRGFAQFEEGLERLAGAEDSRRRMRMAGELVERLNREIESLDERRARLMAIKDRVLALAHGAAGRLFPSYDERSVVYALLDEGLRGASDLAARLDMRESLITGFLRRLTAEKILI